MLTKQQRTEGNETVLADCAAEWSMEGAEVWLEAENAEPYLLDVVGDREE